MTVTRGLYILVAKTTQDGQTLYVGKDDNLVSNPDNAVALHDYDEALDKLQEIYDAGLVYISITTREG